MRIELAERMVQFPQHLADKLTHLAEWMVYGNALLRPDIREHSALIEKASAHRKSSRRISGKSESPHVRSGEVFQQTVSQTEHCRRRFGHRVSASGPTYKRFPGPQTSGVHACVLTGLYRRAANEVHDYPSSPGFPPELRRS